MENTGGEQVIDNGGYPQQQQQQQPPPPPPQQGYEQLPPPQGYEQLPPPQQQYYSPPSQYGRNVEVILPIPTTRMYSPLRGTVRMRLLENYKDVTKCQLTTEEDAFMSNYRFRCWSQFFLELSLPLAVFVKTGPKPSEEVIQKMLDSGKIPEQTAARLRSMTRYNFTFPGRMSAIFATWIFLRCGSGYIDNYMFDSYLANYRPSILHDYAAYLEYEGRRAGEVEPSLPYVPHPPIPVGY